MTEVSLIAKQLSNVNEMCQTHTRQAGWNMQHDGSKSHYLSEESMNCRSTFPIFHKTS